jgi:hypothetical protein
VPATPKALDAHGKRVSQTDETLTLLKQIAAQQTKILEAIEKLAAK